MEIINAFKAYLQSADRKVNKTTLKNYLSDVRKFLAWYQITLKREFLPRRINPGIIELYLTELEYGNEYKKISPLSPRSIKRYSSSLTKFFDFLIDHKLLSFNPATLPTQKPKIIDRWRLTEFKNYLYSSKSGKNTIKNYMADMVHFSKWVTMVSQSDDPEFAVNISVVNEYKKRLLTEAGLSPISINRKLSSIRKYLIFASQKGIIKNITELERELTRTRILSQKNSQTDVDTNEKQASSPNIIALQSRKEYIPDREKNISPEYSGFPPLRLLQVSKHLLFLLLDGAVIISLAKIFIGLKYNLWKLTGKSVFIPISEMLPAIKDNQIKQSAVSSANHLSLLDRFIIANNKKPISSIRNLPKTMYAPLGISTTSLTFWKRLIHNIRFKRPDWYHKYHSIKTVNYVHFGLLLAFLVFGGLSIYNKINNQAVKNAVLGQSQSPTPRIIPFQGKLTNTDGEPIKTPTEIKFAIYNDEAASNNTLLWSESQTVTPDLDGRFSVSLGKNTAINESLFNPNQELYLGITIGNGRELKPRQSLANVSNSYNSQLLQGLKPITEVGSGEKNVILALDSIGNLTIGGTANPVFQATGGDFSLSGQSLILSSNSGSNGNVIISPDGSGIIDLQKPLQNTSEGNNLGLASGAVEIADNLVISNSDNDQSALIINQNGSGNLISSQSDGFAKFVVDRKGNTTIAGDLNINGENIKSNANTFNLLTGSVRNINIGWSESEINLNGLLNAKAGIVIPEKQSIKLEGFSIGSIPFINTKNLLDVDSSFFFDAVNKRLGVGTAVPAFALDVRDSKGTSTSAQIYNTDTSSDADGLLIKLGNTGSTVSTNNHFINFETNGLGLVGSIQGNGSNGVTYKTSGVADFAEYFKKDESTDIPYGSIVCLDDQGFAVLCDDNFKNVIGVASKNPAFLGGIDNGNKSIEVGLTGVVKTFVSSQNGEIKPGDLITTSNNQGVGVKTIDKGFIVGRALEKYNNTDQNIKGNIMITLQTGFYDPFIYVKSDGNLSNSVTISPQNEGNTQTPNIITENAQIKEFIDNIKLGLISINQITTDSLSVTGERIFIGGVSLREYVKSIVLEILDERDQNTKKDIIVINPIAEPSQTATQSAEIQTTPTLTPTPSPIIDNDQTATDSAKTSDDEKIEQANNLFHGIEPQSVSSPSASISAEPSTTPVPTETLDSEISNLPNITELLGETASLSGQIVKSENLNADFATFNYGLISLGPVSLTDTAVSGKLRINDTFIIDDTSINTVGIDLNIQPLRQGNISFMAGLVVIDTQGNLNVEGDANFAQNVKVAGRLSARIIAPIPDEDLIFEIGSKSENEQSHNSSFIIQNSNNKEVLRINDTGSITASGSGTFSDFKIVRGAQADTSFTETVASSSAGFGVISAHEKTRTIKTPFVKEGSLIYISSTSDTLGQTPFVSRQLPDVKSFNQTGSFTVEISRPQNADIKFNWWIIN